jgi:hypothetical protein
VKELFVILPYLFADNQTIAAELQNDLQKATYLYQAG